MRRMSSLEEEVTPPRSMESTTTPMATRRLVLARRSIDSIFWTWRGSSCSSQPSPKGTVSGLDLLDVLEYPEQRSAFGKVRHRWSKQPKRVRSYCQHLGPNDVLHITDQEQAHLAPPRSSQRPKVVITVHDLFHLFPFEQRVVLTDGENAMGESLIEVVSTDPRSPKGFEQAP